MCYGKLDPRKRRRQRCAARSCSSARRNARPAITPPYYTDNPMHNLQVERFFKPQNDQRHDGHGATGRSRRSPCAASKIRRRIFHDGRLLTLEDTVEFFNLILQLN